MFRSNSPRLFQLQSKAAHMQAGSLRTPDNLTCGVCPMMSWRAPSSFSMPSTSVQAFQRCWKLLKRSCPKSRFHITEFELPIARKGGRLFVPSSVISPIIQADTSSFSFSRPYFTA